MAAGALALIADISIEEFAREMFKAGSNLKDKSPEEIFYQDYKKFIAEGRCSALVWVRSVPWMQMNWRDQRESDSVYGQRMWTSWCINEYYFMLTIL